MNNREGRAARLPAGNAVTDAASPAKMYAALIGEVDGVRLLKPETVEGARTLRTGEMVAAGDLGALQFGGPLRYGLGFWAFFASRPALYRMATGVASRVLHLAGRNKGRFASLPFAGGWTRYRDLAAPEGATFQSQWRARSGAVR